MHKPNGEMITETDKTSRLKCDDETNIIFKIKVPLLVCMFILSLQYTIFEEMS